MIDMFGEQCEDSYDHLPLFATNKGNFPTKKQMIEGWKQITPVDVDEPTGHTPRRSGAKDYAREGWSWPAIRWLGRWASLVVLEYIEAAIAESGLNETQNSDGLAVPKLLDRIAKLETLLKEFAIRQTHRCRRKSCGALWAKPRTE